VLWITDDPSPCSAVPSVVYSNSEGV